MQEIPHQLKYWQPVNKWWLTSFPLHFPNPPLNINLCIRTKSNFDKKRTSILKKLCLFWSDLTPIGQNAPCQLLSCKLKWKMCLSQESLDRAGVRQELMPFVYISLLNFHLSSLYKMLLFLELVAIFHTYFPGIFPSPIQTMLHFEHVTLLTLRVGLELFCSFFSMNLNDALHNFNIGSIQWMIHLAFHNFLICKNYLSSSDFTKQQSRGLPFRFTSSGK